MSSPRGILLINLGSPESPDIPAVRHYLREFLMDPYVLDVPWPLRALIVHGCILPFRPKRSAEAYQKIWTAKGSPLVATSHRVKELLREALGPGYRVELGLRYPVHSIATALERLQADGVTETHIVPLFPHYAMSSYGTAVEAAQSLAAQVTPEMRLTVAEPFFDHPAYIQALTASASAYLRRPYDHLLFSFHGLPERHLRKADPTRSHCLAGEHCCETPSQAHRTCYRFQCFQTMRAFAQCAGVHSDQYSIAFQSRLGSDRWLAPSTEAELARLAQSGVRRLAVICPAFVADCLETLEEIAIRGRETFLKSGGESFTLIPCLNDHPAWIHALAHLVTLPTR